MAGPTKYIAAGTQYAFLGFVSNEYNTLLGSNTSAPAPGAGSPMYRLLGIQAANPGVTESEDIDVPGDDGVLGQIQFPPDTLPSFVVELGAHDLTLESRLQGTNVQTLGQMQIGVLQPNEAENPDACLILQSKSKSKDDISGGAKAWSGMIIPRATAQPLGRESFEGRAASSTRVQFTTQAATHTPWGVTITDSNWGTTGAPIMTFTSEYPIFGERVTGAITNYTLALTPAGQSRIVIHVNGAPLTPGADFTLSGRDLTFTPALAANARGVIWYEWLP